MLTSFIEKDLSYILYDEIESNPCIETIERGIRIFREESCNFLVGFGGGSPIDSAKAIGILMTNAGPLKQYEGANKVLNPIPPLFAVPSDKKFLFGSGQAEKSVLCMALKSIPTYGISRISLPIETRMMTSSQKY